MFIGSSYNLKNKVSSNPILISNKPTARTKHCSCLGVNMDEGYPGKNRLILFVLKSVPVLVQ